MKEKVNHPDHYNNGKYEVMDVIEDAGFDEGFCLGNALKYILRARHKENYLEDLKKAKWYLEYLIKRNEDGK
jgi:hypothetical protein